MIRAKERIIGCMAVIFLSECILILFTLAIQVHREIYSPQNISIPLETKSIPDETPLHFLVAVVEIVCTILSLVQVSKY